MKHCTNCGKEIRPGLSYCIQCGRQLSTDKTKEDTKTNFAVPNIFPKSFPWKTFIAFVVIIIGIITFFSYSSELQRQHNSEVQNMRIQSIVETEKNKLIQEQMEIDAVNMRAEDFQKQAEIDQIRRDKEASEAQSLYELQVKENEKIEADNSLQFKKNQDVLLAQDNDGDGLTLRQEQNLGTDPEKADTDADGIIDGKDTNPAGGGRYLNAHVAGYELIVHSDYFDYFKNMERSSLYGDNYVHAKEQYMQNLIAHLKTQSSAKGTIILDEIISFVHDMDYVYDSTLGYDEYPKYPVETLIEQTGDCEDTSILMASLLKGAGFDVVFLNPPGHMAVGIKCDFTYGYVTYNGNKYCYLESTSHYDWQIGEMPESYKNAQFNVYPIS